MSDEQNPQEIENEPKAADELSEDELNNVVGGTGPTVTQSGGNENPVESISLNYGSVQWTYTKQP